MTFSRRPAGARRSTARPSRSAANVGAGRSAKHVPQQAVEQLEPRVVLSLAGSAPAPAIGQLEDPGNAIIRLATNFGDIDIELFNDTAPNTVNNIMRLTRAGRYDQSFFHRLVDGFVLQGGGFGFLDATGFNEVQDFGTVDNEFVRSNLERTLSIAKLGGDPDSGSSQFFINLQDNSANLDNQNGGFTVFARVLDDRSWGVVQNITSNVVTDDFTSVDPPLTSALNETPVRSGTAGNAATEDNLVYIVDAEVIKGLGADGLYEHRLAYPEGFRGGASATTLALTNPNTVSADYQVILRYASGRRDQAVAFGTLAPHETKFLNYQAGLAFAFPNTSFAVEVWSNTSEGGCNPQPISAHLSHQSNGNAPGSVAGESLVDPSNLPEAAKRNWLFGGLPTFNEYVPGGTAERNAFLQWQNLEARDGIVQVRLLFSDRDPIVNTFELDALRRDGMPVARTAEVGTNFTGFHVISTVDIVAGITTYDAIRNGSGDIVASSAAMTPGVPNLASTRGSVAGVAIPASPANATLTISNREAADATVTLRYVRSSGATVTRAVTVPGDRAREVVLDSAALGIPVGESFTVLYESTGRVAVHAYVGSVRDNGTVGVGATPAAIYASSSALFAAPPLPGETLTVFNPSTNAAVTVSFQIQLHFYNGTVETAPLVSLGALGRVDVNVASLAAQVGRAGEGYSYTSVSEGRSGAATVPSAIIAQRSRLGNGFQDVLSNATTPGDRFNLDGPRVVG